MEVQIGQEVMVRNVRFGGRAVPAKVTAVRRATIRVSYRDPRTNSSGSCVVKLSNVEPV